ncbi:MAG TPA: NUDIX domain-containing protein [Candidatus Paceibacterota bacterium]
MKKSVGFLALVEYEGLLLAVLQVRGPHNVEKGLCEESWPGGCQVTIHGKTEPDESVNRALLREAREEIGVIATDYIRELLENGHAELVYELHKEEKVVLTYAAVLPYEFIQEIRWHPSSGGLRLMAEHEIVCIKDLTKSDIYENIGILCRIDVAMFPDEIEAVKKAFQIFDRATTSL